MASVRSLLGWRAKNEFEREERIEAALSNCTGDIDEQLDAIAQARNYFYAPDHVNQCLNAYVASNLSLQEAISTLADPIDEAYTTANHGRAYWTHEQTARTQRKYLGVENAAKTWGVEQDFPEIEFDESKSTEAQLWNLWYGVIHAARKISWKEEIKQSRLINLIITLKARPNPPLPANITPAMQRDWIYEDGKLWSQLTLFGASSREAWNDSPGCGAGYHPLELRAWTNLNAFMARLCAEHIVPFWTFSLWAMNDMCDADKRSQKRHKIPLPTRLGGAVPATAAWINAAGPVIFLIATGRTNDFPDIVQEYLKDNVGDSLTMKVWVIWKDKFKQLSRNTSRLDDEIKQIASEAAQTMKRIELESDVVFVSMPE